ncbi:hypothetical protein R2F61_07535 [Mollicutes bacterium LVI A0078]|nr:hypothetical protein RZE84_07310 [Mollicutes bacterium LVI A0075]WOO90576.1 hypothetical protein R2F61_07535 [Mollicutes bacterium LVI A0078]
MKVGMRKTNYKRRAKNNLWKSTVGITPATAKRRVKKKVNPLYGTKVSGTMKPKKKVYNKVYKKTTFSIWK